MHGSQFSAGFAALLAFYASNWAQGDWYLDAATGSDTNSGINPAAPLKTGAELLARLGPRPQWNHSVVIHIGVGGCADPLIMRGDITVIDCNFTIVGTPVTSVAAGTVATFTGVDHVTPRASQITTTGIADWTPYVEQRLRVVGGANDGSVAWIAKANPHGLGNNFARTSPWYKKSDLVPGTNLFTAANPAVGDTIVIETMPTIASIDIDIGGPVNSTTAGTSWAKRQCVIDSIATNVLWRSATGDALVARTVTFGCKLRSAITRNTDLVVGINQQDWAACFFDGGAANLRLTGALVGCMLKNAPLAIQPGGSIMQMTNCLSQGCALQFIVADFNIGDIQVFDMSGATSNAFFLQRGTFSNLSGSDNAGFGLSIPNRAFLRANAAGALNVLATVSQVRLFSAPSVNLTWAQLIALFPVKDFAQAGTATIGATAPGYVDVALPYWDQANQRVEYSERDHSGHPAATVTCPSANRTAAGFRLASDSAIDTSTYDWFVTPLGREIFIASA